MRRFAPLLLASLLACNAVAPGIDFTVCALKTYAGEPAGAPIGQVTADIIAKCGGDAASVVRVLDAHEPPAIHATVAHGAP